MPEATDADTDSDDLTYSILADGEETTSPAGLTFDADNRSLKGSPAEAMDPKPYTYKVVDSDENEDTINFFITVKEPTSVANNAPVFADTAKIEDIVATVGQPITGKILPKATDADGDTLTYSITPDVKEIGLAFNDTATIRALTGTQQKRRLKRFYAYKAADADGAEAVIPFFITVSGTPEPPRSLHLDATPDNGVITLKGMLAANGFGTIGADDLPNIHQFFLCRYGW